MKVYTDKTYKYAHIVEIDKFELSKIDLDLCAQPKETLSSYYNRQKTKPDVLINAGFFSLKSGESIWNLINEGKVIVSSNEYVDGFGITKDHKTMKLCTKDATGIVDFVTAYPVLVRNKKICTPWTYAKEINYKALRTMVGYNDSKYFIVMVDKPGLGFTAMANLMIRIGCTDAINLDGGGSSRCLVNGKVINTPTENRKVDSVMAFYIKKTTSTSSSTTNTSNPSLYYNYTVKKGDSWWAIAARETGKGTNYTKLQEYNNWKGTALVIGTKIKIPYSMSIIKNQSTETNTSTSETVTETAEYYEYTIKKGDSWWAIATRETGKGANYTKLQEYNNWNNTPLVIGSKIKIPYSLKK